VGSGQGPEYLVLYKHDGREMAAGRTSLRWDAAGKPLKSWQREAIDSVLDWLKGHDLAAIYDSFNFVDRQKRALQLLLAATLQISPELEHGAQHQICGSQAINLLELTAGDRTCRVHYVEYRHVFHIKFDWDLAEMFNVETDDPVQIATLLKRWLCDRAVPSALQAEFPLLTMGPLASYYEQGRGVEGEFILSWDEVERFYLHNAKCEGVAQNSTLDYTQFILGFLAEVRRAGYDRKLRTGTSLLYFMVSRSRRYGLRRNQPYIAFDFKNGQMAVTMRFEEKNQFIVPQIAFTPQIAAIFDRLAAYALD
jgi:hypothetical protein